MSDKMQNSGEESDKNKSTSKEEKKDNAGENKEESNCSIVNQLCTVAQGRCSAPITSSNDPDFGESGMSRTKRRLSEDSQIPTPDNICNKQGVSLRTTNSFENISNLGNSSTEGHSESNRRRSLSSSIKQCDTFRANSRTDNRAIKIPNPANTFTREMIGRQQNSSNLNNHECVPEPKLSLSEVLTCGDKPSNKTILTAYNKLGSSSRINHNPHLKPSSDGAENIVPLSNFKADKLDADKGKDETEQEASEEVASGNEGVLEEQGHGKTAIAGEDCLTYFKTNKNVETKADRSTNNSLLKSKPGDKVPSRHKETANLKDRYSNNFVKRASDNIDTNKFGGNSIRNNVGPISDENSECMKIQLSTFNGQTSKSESSVQGSNATRNKMFAEGAPSVIQSHNANSQESVETTNADVSNTKQQYNNNLANKCIELEKRVYQLQCDNDRIKKDVKDMTHGNSTLRNENVKAKKLLEETQQLITKCSSLVDPLIKELEYKEPFWKFLLRYATGKTLMSSNIIGKIGIVCDYAKTITHHTIKLTSDLKRKEEQTRYLQSEVKKVTENFEQKTAEQLKIIKEAEAKQKKELEAKKNIEDKFKVLEGDIKKYKEELIKYKGQSEEIQSLQKYLHKQNQALIDFERHTYFLQNRLQGAELQQQNFKENITVTHDELHVAEQHFRQSFGSFETGVTKHSKVLSLEEVSKKAEQNFIDHALQRIAEIRKGAAQYEPRIKEFEGNRESKTYLDIKEKLRRRIQELDTVESHTRKEILAARKEAINYVTILCDDLERKVINC